MDVDLYKFFDLQDHCSTKDVKRAYREKARQLHPDKNMENPIAKEQFQQLKAYYEILHDPVSRKEYDKKWMAKRESAKRHAALDEHRRKLKEKLEAQEANARRERELRRQQSATNAAADQFRQEWKRHAEQMEHDAYLARKRARENQAKVDIEQSQLQVGTVVRFGEVDAVIMGKRGTAVVEFRSRQDAVRAVDASTETTIGLPDLPLHLSLIETPSSANQATNAESPTNDRNNTSNVKPKIPHSPNISETPLTNNFDSFESDILKRMASFISP